MFGRQVQKAHGAGVARKRQARLHRALRGTPAGRVAVKAEDDRIGEAEQLLHVVGGARRAQRGHCVREAGLGQRDHVHVAFDDEGVAALAQRSARFKQAVEFAALAEKGCFGRIEVFGFTAVEHATAKADHIALHRADREHDPVPKAVVALDRGRRRRVAGVVWRSGTGSRAAGDRRRVVVLLDDHHAALAEQRVVVVGKHAGEPAPAFRGITQAELRCDFTAQRAAFQIVHGARAELELAPVVLGRFRQHIGQGGAALFLGGGLVALGRRLVVFGQGQSDLLGQVLHRIDEGHAAVFGQEADGVAVRPAAEAVIELFARADGEAGRLFGMKRTQATQIGTALAELHMAPDELDDVDAGKQVVNESRWNHRLILRGGLRAAGHLFCLSAPPERHRAPARRSRAPRRRPDRRAWRRRCRCLVRPRSRS